jgi:hypothetical protein
METVQYWTYSTQGLLISLFGPMSYSHIHPACLLIINFKKVRKVQRMNCTTTMPGPDLKCFQVKAFPCYNILLKTKTKILFSSSRLWHHKAGDFEYITLYIFHQKCQIFRDIISMKKIYRLKVLNNFFKCIQH